MKFTKQHIIRHAILDSTNMEAWRLIKSGLAIEGSIIQSGFQTAGKGQGGAMWESDKDKNLLFSWIVKPRFLQPSQQFMITKTFSVALQETVSGWLKHHQVTIKWPNDIYVGQKKIAGMLIENSIMGSNIEYAVIGIGINVNQTIFHSDAPNPVSVKQLTGEETVLDDCLHMVGESMNKWYQKLQNNDTEIINQTYLQHLLGFDSIMHFTDHRRSFSAKISGISEYGKLIIDENGSIREYDMKEIAFV
jgi:BirA family transcriptional regulator, biotin operon repressor / biotin---[acetyl-CoA-carboxylase] ligase